MTRPRLSSRDAHDLRGPLSQILIWGQIAELPVDAELRERALVEIRQAALQQAELIDRMVKPRCGRGPARRPR